MTFENALKKIKTLFNDVDVSKLADMAVQVTLTDEDCGGTLYFKSENGSVVVEGYDYRDNDAVIDIQRKALNDILTGKTTLDKAIDKGVATVKGNFEKVSTLNDAIVKKAPAKKAPAKKAAPAKKETVKKETVKKETVKKAEAKKETAVKAEAKPAAKKAEAKKAEPAKKETKTAAKKTVKKA